MRLLDGFMKYMTQLGMDEEAVNKKKGEDYTVVSFGQQGEDNVIYKIVLVLYDNEDAVEIYISRRISTGDLFSVLTRVNELNKQYFGLTFYTEMGEISTKSFCKTGGDIEIALAQMLQNMQIAFKEFAEFK